MALRLDSLLERSALWSARKSEFRAEEKTERIKELIIDVEFANLFMFRYNPERWIFKYESLVGKKWTRDEIGCVLVANKLVTDGTDLDAAVREALVKHCIMGRELIGLTPVTVSYSFVKMTNGYGQEVYEFRKCRLFDC